MIPEELRRIPQWVCAVQNSKMPFDVHGVPASVRAPGTWASYEKARRVVERGKADYVGFVFGNNGIVGIDIDAGYDGDGMMTLEAAEIIKRFGSYTEKSRSGRGFHILAYGDIPFDGRNNRKGIEVYKTGRYFIMTGKTVRYEKIIPNQEALDWLIEKHFAQERVTRSGKSVVPRIYNPEWQRPQDGRIKLRPIYPAIPQGCRNICLTSLGGLMHNTGYDAETIFRELCYANETACQPTLDEREIESIVSSVTRYKR